MRHFLDVGHIKSGDSCFLREMRGSERLKEKASKMNGTKSKTETERERERERERRGNT